MSRRLTIRSKLLIALAIPVAAMAALLVMTVAALQTAQIGGPRYDRISQTKELAADLGSPAASLQEAELTVQKVLLVLPQAGSRINTVPTEIGPLADRLVDLDRQFAAGVYRRERTVPAGALRDKLLQDVHPTGSDFFRLMRVELLPAVRAGQVNRANEIAETRLQPIFEDNIAALKEARLLADANVLQVETTVKDAVSSQLSIVALFAMAAAAVTTIAGLIMASSISRPVRRLTDAASAAADQVLPALVDRIRNGAPDQQLEMPEAFTGEGTDELVQLANALNAMQTTAIDLAVSQARARTNVAANLASLGRRNQGLLARAGAGLKELGARNPTHEDDQLVRLDRLVTRAKRNAESLLVLAGSEPPKARSGAPVAIAAVVATAAQRIEASDRLATPDLDPIGVHGLAADDVVGLLAELIENAANFSPPERPVRIKGELRADGYQISIIDEGIGMSIEALSLANRRVSTASEFDQTTSRVFGLMVVGHRSQRNGIEVRLDQAASGRGIAVRIKLPPPILQRQPATPVVVGRRTPLLDSGNFDSDLCITEDTSSDLNRRVDADLATQYVDGNVLLLPVVEHGAPKPGDAGGNDVATPPSSRLEPSLAGRVTRRVPGSHFPDPTILSMVKLPNNRP